MLPKIKLYNILCFLTDIKYSILCLAESLHLRHFFCIFCAAGFTFRSIRADTDKRPLHTAQKNFIYFKDNL